MSPTNLDSLPIELLYLILNSITPVAHRRITHFSLLLQCRRLNSLLGRVNPPLTTTESILLRKNYAYDHLFPACWRCFKSYPSHHGVYIQWKTDDFNTRLLPLYSPCSGRYRNSFHCVPCAIFHCRLMDDPKHYKFSWMYEPRVFWCDDKCQRFMVPIARSALPHLAWELWAPLRKVICRDAQRGKKELMWTPGGHYPTRVELVPLEIMAELMEQFRPLYTTQEPRWEVLARMIKLWIDPEKELKSVLKQLDKRGEPGPGKRVYDWGTESEREKIRLWVAEKQKTLKMPYVPDDTAARGEGI